MTSNGYVLQFTMIVALLISFSTVSAQDCALEKPINAQRTEVLPNNKLFDIDVNSSSRKILLHWDNLVSDGDLPPQGVPDSVTEVVEKIESTLNSFAQSGFRQLPGVAKCSTNDVVTVYLYETVGTNNPGGNAWGANVLDLRYSSQSKRHGTIAADLSPTIIHELFHNTQSTYRLGNAQRWFIEGTASFVPEIFDAQIDQTNSTGNTCENQLLRTPGFNIARRHSPWRDGTNACQSKLFWNYFTEQIGALKDEPRVGVDALLGLFEALERQPRSWRISNDDEVLGAADFDGDGREEILIRSDTHLGLLGVTYGERRVLAVQAIDGRARLGDNGWLLRRNDEVLGFGDMNGDGRNEFVIRSSTHIGFIGAESDGTFATIAVVPHDVGRFGNGWRSKISDRILSIGDLNGDGSDELLVASSSHIGVVGLTNSNASQTVAVHLRSAPLPGNRIFGEPTFVSDKGDLNSDGRHEFILKDEQGLFVLGLRNDNKLQVIDSVSDGDRVGTGWKLTSTDELLGIGDLNAAFRSDGDEFIIRSQRYFGILGLSARNQLETRRVFITGRSNSANRLFEQEFRVVDVAGFDEDIGAEILLQRDDEFAVVKISDSDWNTEQIAKRQLTRNDPFNSVSIVGQMNGGPQNHVLHKDQNGWQTFAIYNDIGLFQESYSSVGEYFYSFDQKLDSFIRSRTAGDRGLDDLWRDFSIALYVKDLTLNDSNPAWSFQDERNDQFSHDYDDDTSTPPVRVSLSIRPEEEDRDQTIAANRWSSAYFMAEASDTARQTISITIGSSEISQSEIFSAFIVSKGDTLVRMEPSTFLPQSGLSRDVELDVGERLGIVVPSSSSSADFTVHLSSRVH